MRQITKQEMKRLEGYRVDLQTTREKIAKVIEKAKAEITPMMEDAEETRKELWGFLDDLANSAQSYYDEKSEKWQEGDNGQQYQSWISELENLRDEVPDEFALLMDEGLLEDFDKTIEAIDEEKVTLSPDQV